MSQTFNPQVGMTEQEKHLLNVFLSNGGNTWQAVTYENSWDNYNATTHRVGRYSKDMWGRVWVEATADGGTRTAATVIFTLPVGYRPAKAFGVVCSQTTAGGVDTTFHLSVGTNGQCALYGVDADTALHIGFSFTLA